MYVNIKANMIHRKKIILSKYMTFKTFLYGNELTKHEIN